MKNSYSNVTNLEWTNQYNSSARLFTSDSLSWEKTLNLLTFDWMPVSFLQQTNFLKQYFLIDSVTKISFLDTLLIKDASVNFLEQTLFGSLMSDRSLSLLNAFAEMLMSFNSANQDIITESALLLPEVSLMITHKAKTYEFSSSISFSTAPTFDSYSVTSQLEYSEITMDIIPFMLFILFITAIFLPTLLLAWRVVLFPAILKIFYYSFSVSRETRIEFETLLQTALFFLFFWGFVLMAFDDEFEETIEFVNSGFFVLFTLFVVYLIVKHSVHYFTFLESSLNDGRTAVFLTKQFFRDILNTLSLMLRFYVLIFRINVYDLLDDVLDSYYIFVGDFDDDEYINELFYSLHGTLFFTNDNHDDRSFLLEDESGFHNDLFFLYFIVWGKFNFFLFFMLEELARLALALYISFLILFEVHAVNCSFREDNFLESKQGNN